METIGDIIFLIFLSFVSASTSLLLNYALGLHNDTISTGEIFFKYTYWLSVNRLKKEKDFDFLKQALDVQVVSIGLKTNLKEPDPLTKNTAKTSGQSAIVERAKSFFRWEKAFGMCIYCTGVWIAVILSILTGLVFQLSFFQVLCLLLSIPALSHLILRKI